MQTQIVRTITAPLAANVGEGLLEMEHFVQACFISVMIVVFVVCLMLLLLLLLLFFFSY